MKKATLSFLVFFSLKAIADPEPSIKFIENKNQWPHSIQFVGRVQNGAMLIQPGRFTYAFLDGRKLEALHERTHRMDPEIDKDEHADEQVEGVIVSVEFLKANSQAVAYPFGRSREYYNYFIGNDAGKWASKAYAYDGVLYCDLYTGIDLKVYSVGDHGKYDLIISPLADPSQIVLRYEGMNELMIENGNLHSRTNIADIIEKRPFAYQFIGGNKTEVRCEFQLDGDLLSFCFPDGYDPCYELIIDPLLIFSTYSGSAADNWGSTATPGEKGNLYSAGVTNHFVGGVSNPIFSGTFPASSGAFQTTYGGLYDIGILKYDSLGQQLLYASYLGGSHSESPHSLVMNAQQELIVLGTTSSLDFPTSENSFNRNFSGGSQISHVVNYDNGSDIFVARISKDGTDLLASTYIGGSKNDGLNPAGSELNVNYGDHLRGDVITDSDGNIYISTVTVSDDFPIINTVHNQYKGGESDAVLMKLPPELNTITWSMFLGGSKTDAAHTLQLDNDLDIYLAGGTTSADMYVSEDAYQKTFGGVADGWIAKVDNGGQQIYYSTYTGTSQFNQIYFLDLNETGEVYVYGQTAGSFPILPDPASVYNVPNSGQFVQKFNRSLSALEFSTVFGTGKGVPDISPTAFIVNECNNLYLAGWGGALNNPNWASSTLNLQTTPDAIQRTTVGNDFYFVVLTADASELLYATFLGGTQSRTHVDGGTSRFDKGGIVYHAVCSGCSSGNTALGPSSDFPTTEGAWSRVNRSRNCNNLAFKFDLSSLKARLQTNSISLNHPGLNTVCIPDEIVFQNFSTGGEIFEWDFGDGSPLMITTDKENIVHEYKNTGQYKVTLKAIDRGTCIVEDIVTTMVVINDADATIQGDDNLCRGSSYTLKASGGAQYQWRSEDGSFESTSATPLVSPQDTTRYYITVTEANGCIHEDSVTLNVIPLIVPDFEVQRLANCVETPSVYVKNVTDSLKNGDQMYFDFGDGSTSDAEEVEHIFENEGVYNVKLIGVREFCVTEKTVTMPFMPLKIPNVITPAALDNKNDSFIIELGKKANATPADFGYKVSLIVYNRWGRKVYEAEDYQYDWAGQDLAPGVYYFEVQVEDHATCRSWVQVIK